MCSISRSSVPKFAFARYTLSLVCYMLLPLIELKGCVTGNSWYSFIYLFLLKPYKGVLHLRKKIWGMKCLLKRSIQENSQQKERRGALLNPGVQAWPPPSCSVLLCRSRLTSLLRKCWLWKKCLAQASGTVNSCRLHVSQTPKWWQMCVLALWQLPLGCVSQRRQLRHVPRCVLWPYGFIYLVSSLCEPRTERHCVALGGALISSCCRSWRQGPKLAFTFGKQGQSNTFCSQTCWDCSHINVCLPHHFIWLHMFRDGKVCWACYLNLKWGQLKFYSRTTNAYICGFIWSERHF